MKQKVNANTFEGTKHFVVGRGGEANERCYVPEWAMLLCSTNLNSLLCFWVGHVLGVVRRQKPVKKFTSLRRRHRLRSFDGHSIHGRRLLAWCPFGSAAENFARYLTDPVAKLRRKTSSSEVCSGAVVGFEFAPCAKSGAHKKKKRSVRCLMEMGVSTNCLLVVPARPARTTNQPYSTRPSLTIDSAAASSQCRVGAGHACTRRAHAWPKTPPVIITVYYNGPYFH